jgi:GcrA cell cycle regulator
MSHSDFWTAERTDRARELAATKSARDIAADLGCTRNSVISKLSRIGVPLTKNPPNPPKPNPPKRDIRPRLAPPPTMPRQARAKAAGAFLPVGGCLIADLTEIACRWPLWRHDGPVLDRRYCGRQSAGGLPYCRDHCRQAYRSAGP